ncbi:hypothetical protein FHR24_001571 [Wenyingzhuangia heitensis]|uniref:Uncharacterized protein n=1 Tax=Wenyingzhuangia heitensis TaxID=1487859 RepID=A0ABX0U8I2_9FLAO|nr:hypothetical protein [Wenyingzhuangia heitensis]NIJ45132.1 hypothetical protein [Wenyingzhuangia heitensis]
MNDFFALFFEFLFDYDANQDLLDAVFNNGDYKMIGLSIILISIISPFLFYKVWDPIQKQLLKYVITLLIVGIIQFVVTNYVLNINNDILNLIGNYSSESYHMDPDLFIMTMGAISMIYVIIISFLTSRVIKKMSINNKYNPF